LTAVWSKKPRKRTPELEIPGVTLLARSLHALRYE